MNEPLRQSEERFRLLVEGVKDYAIFMLDPQGYIISWNAIFMLDPQGYIISWNAGVERIKGYTADDIIGQHFSRFYTPDDLARGWPARELEIAKVEGRLEDEGWRVRKDGTRFWANVVITALRDETGDLCGFAKVTRDLTERRRVEALEAERRRTNEFLAMLGHELRNPLAPIRNAVALLQRKGLGDPTLDWARDVIDRQVTHLTRLVDDLLDVSRIVSGKIALQREPVKLSDVVARAVEASRPLVDVRRHTLEVSLPGEPLRIDGDPTRLAQVLTNLLNNAAKYTPEGGHIRLSAAQEGDRAVVRVRDTGVGMSAELLERAFDPFTQGQRDLDRSEGGLGIGLTLVKKLVELHGGTVEARSEGPGRGSEFVVRLPLAEGAGKTEPPGTLAVFGKRDGD